MSEERKYRIGCPVWSCPHWRGSVYRKSAPRSDWLKEYSRIFSTVEGNSTFYGIPAVDTFQRWADETCDGFRFALKFPRTISHEHQLLNVQVETDAFLEGLSILHESNRLGPSFLQLSPWFDPTRLDQLQRYLLRLPVQFSYAVEVRHPGFFQSPVEDELNAFLRELGIDRVIFDSRPLFSHPPTDEIEEAAQQRKPKVPVRPVVTGSNPILRLIGRNDVSAVQAYIDGWVQQVAQWISAGHQPYVFTHTPDDRFAPELAQRFQDAMTRQCTDIKPIELKNQPAKRQRSLF